MKENIKKYIKENKRNLKILVYFLLIGILIGILMYVLEPNINKEKIIESIKETLNLAKEDNFKGINILINGLKSYIIFAIFLVFASCTIITSPILIIYTLIKGFSVGVFMATLMSIFNLKNGFITVILIGIIPNLIYIPVMFYLILETIRLNESIVTRNKDVNKLKELLKYSIRYISTFPLYFLSLFLEQILFKIVLNIYLKMLH